ncbi:hypothetical protein NBRC116587_22170 [Pseudoteredinibacter isoporae]
MYDQRKAGNAKGYGGGKKLVIISLKEGWLGMSDRANGVVKWFNNARGYGFITRGEGSDDVFVHYRSIRGEGYRSLAEGQKVEFDLQDGDKGLQAEDVVCL